MLQLDAIQSTTRYNPLHQKNLWEGKKIHLFPEQRIALHIIQTYLKNNPYGIQTLH